MDRKTSLNKLNPQQKEVCINEGNILLTACPGSGKTRTLTYKLAYSVEKNISSKKLNIAITYTNRAAEEIKDRLEKINIPLDCVWVGTIHQFCLKFIIRPYTMYNDRLRKGYHIIDEYVRKKYIDEITDELGIEIRIDDSLSNPQILKEYRKRLLKEREIDFDNILEISYDLVVQNKFIAENIAGIIRTILVDEYQDTNELQYKILSNIVQRNKSIQMMFVGDVDQAIYGSLGGIAKSREELEREFGIKFQEKKLNGCYRSTQRLVNYYSNFKSSGTKIYAVSDIKNEKGSIVYNTRITTKELYEKIALIVREQLARGIPENEICIIAPQWGLLFPISKKIKELLPNVKLDAPDITPIKYDPMNIFYLISKLLFTEPGRKIKVRKQIAKEIIESLVEEYRIYVSDKLDDYIVLKIINSMHPTDEDGLIYLQKTINEFFMAIDVDLNCNLCLQKAYEDFISKIKYRINRYHLSRSMDTFKQCFKERDGIVVNTFHGVKGEEFTTVIAFGILNGYIPNWKIIYDDTKDRASITNKLLYVVCSRAKKNLYLISEQGRLTRRGRTYDSTEEIVRIKYDYDELK